MIAAGGGGFDDVLDDVAADFINAGPAFPDGAKIRPNVEASHSPC